MLIVTMAKPSQWEATPPAQVLMELWTWRGMYGNGWRTGMRKNITQAVQTEIPMDHHQARLAFCAAAAGTTFRAACAHGLATPARPTTGTTT